MTINKPSAKEVSKYLRKWEKEPELIAQDIKDRCLIKLFNQTFPENVDLEEVLIKVGALNDLYNVNVKSNYKFPFATRIVNLKIDSRILSHDFTLVNDIALVKPVGLRPIKYYSFATKYFSLHFKKAYPIYDRYVEYMLLHFRNEDGFSSFEDYELKCYLKFYKVLLKFQQTYELKCFSFRNIDRYLWTAGKEHFKK